MNDVVNIAFIGFPVVPDQHILPSFTLQKPKNVTAITLNMGGVRPMSDVRAGCCYLLNKIWTSVRCLLLHFEYEFYEAAVVFYEPHRNVNVAEWLTNLKNICSNNLKFI